MNSTLEMSPPINSLRNKSMLCLFSCHSNKQSRFFFATGEINF